MLFRRRHDYTLVLHPLSARRSAFGVSASTRRTRTCRPRARRSRPGTCRPGTCRARTRPTRRTRTCRARTPRAWASPGRRRSGARLER